MGNQTNSYWTIRLGTNCLGLGGVSTRMAMCPVLESRYIRLWRTWTTWYLHGDRWLITRIETDWTTESRTYVSALRFKMGGIQSRSTGINSRMANGSSLFQSHSQQWQMQRKGWDQASSSTWARTEPALSTRPSTHTRKVLPGGSSRLGRIMESSVHLQIPTRHVGRLSRKLPRVPSVNYLLDSTLPHGHKALLTEDFPFVL